MNSILSSQSSFVNGRWFNDRGEAKFCISVSRTLPRTSCGPGGLPNCANGAKEVMLDLQMEGVTEKKNMVLMKDNMSGYGMGFFRFPSPLSLLLTLAFLLGEAQAGRTLLSGVSSPVPSPVCPNPKLENVVVQAYQGVWYEIGSTARFKNIQEKDLICTTARYSIIPEGADAGKVRVRNVGYNISSGEDVMGVAIASVTSPGRFAVSFGGGPPGDYRVLYLRGEAKSGYKIAIVYSCEETFGFQQGLFILSRTPILPHGTVGKLLEMVSDMGIAFKPDNRVILTTQDPISCGRNFD